MYLVRINLSKNNLQTLRPYTNPISVKNEMKKDDYEL